MKKLISVVVAISLILSVLFALTSCLDGCGSSEDKEKKEKNEIPQDPEDVIYYFAYNEIQVSTQESGYNGFEDSLLFFGVDSESVSLIITGIDTKSDEYINIFYCKDKASAKNVAESLGELVENSPLIGEGIEFGYSGKVAWMGYPTVLEAACKRLPCKEHIDDDGDNRCDRCDKKIALQDDPAPPNHDVGENTQKTEIAEIIERGYINVGVTFYEPFYYIDDDGNIVGFDAELAEMFAESLGVECRFQIIEWGNKFYELNESKSIDLIWNAISITEDYEQYADFSFAYANNFVLAVTDPNLGIQKEDIPGCRIGVVENSFAHTCAQEEFYGSELYLFDSVEQMLNAIRSGAISVALVCGEDFANGLILGTGEFYDLWVIEGAVYWEETYAVAARRGSALISELNHFLKSKSDDGTLAALSRKYGVNLVDLSSQ